MDISNLLIGRRLANREAGTKKVTAIEAEAHRRNGEARPDFPIAVVVAGLIKEHWRDYLLHGFRERKLRTALLVVMVAWVAKRRIPRRSSRKRSRRPSNPQPLRRNRFSKSRLPCAARQDMTHRDQETVRHK